MNHGTHFEVKMNICKERNTEYEKIIDFHLVFLPSSQFRSPSKIKHSLPYKQGDQDGQDPADKKLDPKFPVQQFLLQMDGGCGNENPEHRGTIALSQAG